MFIVLALYFNLQLNVGGLELPVRSGLPSADTPPSMEALDKLEVIPGVSILVRVLPVTKVGIMYDTRRGGLIYEVSFHIPDIYSSVHLFFLGTGRFSLGTPISCFETTLCLVIKNFPQGNICWFHQEK